jgi:hypothetical protein
MGRKRIGVLPAPGAVDRLEAFRFEGSSMHMDFSTSPAGSIRVELHDFGGIPLKGYTLDDCLELKGEGAGSLVRWKHGCDVSAFAGQLIRMRFSISHADIFGFRFRSSIVK